MREAEFTRAVNKGLPAEVYRWKISDRFTAGIPDSWYSGNLGDLWVEWKYVPKLPAKVKPALSALQLRWLNARHAEGRSVAVIVGSPKGSVLFEDGEWNGHKDSCHLLTKQQLRDWISRRVREVV